MNPTDRFAELLEGPPDLLPLDEAVLLVAAHDHDVDIAGVRAELDSLASRCDASVESVVGLLFEDLGFAGDADDYHHPDNSFLDRVVVRRRGLPILLSVLTAEVAARAGVCLAPVGMPGHFLLRDCADPEGFIDPFHRGRRLDRAGCVEIFTALHPAMRFEERFLDPVDPPALLQRLVTNLVHTYTVRGPLTSLAWAAHLRALLAGGDAWLHVARVRERLGDWDASAEAMARSDASYAVQRAAAIRARAN
jgi:regulator of sirC expression with transglutaminase-like and TPR domain